MGTGRKGKLPSGNYSTVKRAQRLSATSSIRPNGRVQLSICDGVSFWDFDVYELARRSCKYLASLRKNTGRSLSNRDSRVPLARRSRAVRTKRAGEGRLFI